MGFAKTLPQNHPTLAQHFWVQATPFPPRCGSYRSADSLFCWHTCFRTAVAYIQITQVQGASAWRLPSPRCGARVGCSPHHRRSAPQQRPAARPPTTPPSPAAQSGLPRRLQQPAVPPLAHLTTLMRSYPLVQQRPSRRHLRAAGRVTSPRAATPAAACPCAGGARDACQRSWQ